MRRKWGNGSERDRRVPAVSAESKSLGLTPFCLGKESPVFVAFPGLVLGTFLLNPVLPVCLDLGLVGFDLILGRLFLRHYLRARLADRGFSPG